MNLMRQNVLVGVLLTGFALFLWHLAPELPDDGPHGGFVVYSGSQR